MNPQDMARRGLADGDLVARHVAARRDRRCRRSASDGVGAGAGLHRDALGRGVRLGGRAAATASALAGVNALTTAGVLPAVEAARAQARGGQDREGRAALARCSALAWLRRRAALAVREALRPLMAEFAFATCVPFGRERTRRAVPRRRAAAPAPPALLDAIEALLGLDQRPDAPALRRRAARPAPHRAPVAAAPRRRGSKASCSPATPAPRPGSGRCCRTSCRRRPTAASCCVAGAKPPVRRGRARPPGLQLLRRQRARDRRRARRARRRRRRRAAARCCRPSCKCGTNCGSCLPEAAPARRARDCQRTGDAARASPPQRSHDAGARQPPARPPRRRRPGRPRAADAEGGPRDPRGDRAAGRRPRRRRRARATRAARRASSEVGKRGGCASTPQAFIERADGRPRRCAASAWFA